MTCQPGYHQHVGSDGQTMLACHPIKQIHTNPNTRRAHEQAIQNNPSSTRSGMEVREATSQEKPKKTEVPKKKIDYEKSNVADKYFGMPFDGARKKQEYIRRFQRIANDKSQKNIPLLCMFYSMANVARIYDMMCNVKNKHAIENTRKGYLKGWQNLDTIITGEEEQSITTPEQADELKEKVQAQIDRVSKNPSSKRRNTKEYGELKVYADYLRYIDVIYDKNLHRLDREKARAMFEKRPNRKPPEIVANSSKPEKK